jgi:hypothetical protein
MSHRSTQPDALARTYTLTFRKDTPTMDHLHVRQRLEAFAARLRRAAGPGDPGGGDSRRIRPGSSGMRAMDSFGAGRR